MARAACAGADTDLFFIERGESNGPAREFCRSCPVIEECQTFALARPAELGVWGGMSERERRKLRRDRRRAA